jgi:hypothetical protein
MDQKYLAVRDFSWHRAGEGKSEVGDLTQSEVSQFAAHLLAWDDDPIAAVEDSDNIAGYLSRYMLSKTTEDVIDNAVKLAELLANNVKSYYSRQMTNLLSSDSDIYVEATRMNKMLRTM